MANQGASPTAHRVHERFYIGGEYVAPLGSETIDVYSPANRAHRAGKDAFDLSASRGS